MSKRIPKGTPAEVSLPPLKVAIRKGGAIIRIVEIPDPRQAFCKAFNSHDIGQTAEPIDGASSEEGGAL